MTVKGGTSPACAACKYQRRKCISTCPLAPYFPANQPKMFQNVHRLFGVSNVTKLIDKLETKEEKDDAMTSIIYEAEMRERYPVLGCCTVIGQLRQQLYLATEQLRQVKIQLERCRQAEQSRSQSSDCWPVPPLAELGDDAFQSFENEAMFSHGFSDWGFLNEENMVKPLRNFNNSRYSGKVKMHPSFDEGSSTVRIRSNFDEGSSSTAKVKIKDGTEGEKQGNLDAIDEEIDRFGLDERNIYTGQDFDAIYQDNYTYSSAENTKQRDPPSSSEDTTTEHGCRRELETAAADLSLTTVTQP